MKSILFVSNGHGEDHIASVIGQLLKDDVRVRGLPLVGRGRPYESKGIDVVGPAKKMPSGGFVKRDFGYLLKDIRAGFIPMTLGQISAIRRMGADMIVCVGDIYALLLGSVFTKKPVVFMPTAKSDYINSHYPIEIRVMKKYSRKVIARDGLTADGLRKSGLDAVYLGNTMMDALEFSGCTFGLSSKGGDEGKVIGLLPGSREEAYRNFLLLLNCVETLCNIAPLSQKPLEFLLSMAPGLDIAPFIERASSLGWQFKPYAEDKDSRQGPGKVRSVESPLAEGQEHHGKNPSVNNPPVAGIFIKKSYGSIRAVKGYFGDLLKASDIIVGMAGTGNEQAVGYGRPVVAFPGEGPQFTEKFLAVQKKLLGDAVCRMPTPEDGAKAVLEILEDEGRYRHMVDIGAQRMGKPGGAAAIASLIKDMMGEIETC